MTLIRIKAGPIPHFGGDWNPEVASVSGPGYKKEAIVFHRGHSFQSKVNANKVEPAFTYDPNTGIYTCSTGWGLVAVGAGAEVVEQKASIADLLSGVIIPALAGNLQSFAERDDIPVISVQGDAVRTTAGDESINAASGAKLMSIVPTADFTPSKLIISGFNLLRLQNNSGPAIAVGAGWAFPVPACQFGEYGSAKQNNGVIFTDNNNENLGYSSAGRPTVHFLAGTTAPTAVTDGVDMNASSSYYHDDAEHGIRFYLPPAIGWIIVSGITWANTCAHMAWSRLYDAFVSPTSASDAGTIIDLTALGTMRHIGNGVQDRADRIDNTHMRLTTNVGRVASPTWVTTADEVAEGETQTYLHVITVSGIKAGGAAAIEGQTQILTVDGTTVSYRDANENALEGALRYELAAPTTASKAVSTIVNSLHDWGIDILVSSAGAAMVTWQYSQGIPDSLAALVGGGFENAMAVIAHLLCDMDSRINTIRKSLDGGLRSLTVDNLRVINSIDRFDNSGNRIIQSDVAPNVMADFIGQLWHYKDTDHDEWYFATGTTAVSQWKKISLT